MYESSGCELLQDANVYQPDLLDLNSNVQAAEYWFPCFRDMIAKFAEHAEGSQSNDDHTAAERAAQYQKDSLKKMSDYHDKLKTNAGKNIKLSIRELLDLNERQLRRFGFPDTWRKQKQEENAVAIQLLQKRLQEIDTIESTSARWTELIRGVLAGNMFDWGAQAVANILANDTTFGLHAALEHIQKRPWLMDDLDSWLSRVQGKAHKCALIFVDNSGVDVVLGILPFTRELLKRGTKVLLCANTEPSLNDVTSSELNAIIESCTCHCNVLAQAWENKSLVVYGNGQRGPCLDMRNLPLKLCEAIHKYETDLLVIEGMGRALHTNLYAKFNCETLKLAVVKNKWLAQYLGGDTFSVICRYETS
ncbi:4'-phosphopantetheine phosphatase [Teleopsis dalmanni]|uniref:4'-phosphopantetheine phosphatase n=1 Tax=Teleopsis dalmanni TaxID=139649 RepID=UPI0018CD2480|nr:4'-phosphopantetheine phosphatase [Teleopsis dalmanni]XP_037958259.1 4'-phosphopantetheine phosphatase [Teleopsis dalmanni]XP_037958260.1 4'-phosphopantetheine phosphatase [Teleopsis dalmanni]XP_037958261.1 4'-phosphopantetheine phosphatase [Teleopsis dalmanni]XP_037958262.1 4'-phosphopantetheine phosphatase [Teleopsis dalmanni]